MDYDFCENCDNLNDDEFCKEYEDYYFNVNECEHRILHPIYLESNTNLSGA